ncbi:hypothetical protein [Methanococcus maripaludis]|uniref:Uncharacterized protein n=1 Tax=Methanococcus maripaludis TaxID=39152 RepID=A0A7J9PMX9_METMI|nr:hypothetical protein [Methanococcus maripaludis]MBA2864451.1 hypothetical protein [Methanococcus maripaludis]
MSASIQRVICMVNDQGDIWVKCCDKCGAPMKDKRIRNESFAQCIDCGFTEPLN